ncbi:MAG: HK97 gp10 family phage protein [Acutalibacteraceae bacterium]
MAKNNFNNFSSEMEKVLSAAEKGMQKVVTQLQADTELLTHVDSGALRRSWTNKTERDGNGNIYGAVGSNLEYAVYEDNKEGHENLSKAVNDNATNYLNDVMTEIKNNIGG